MFADAVSYKVKKATEKVVSGLKEDILQTRILYKILQNTWNTTQKYCVLFPINISHSKKKTHRILENERPWGGHHWWLKIRFTKSYHNIHLPRDPPKWQHIVVIVLVPIVISLVYGPKHGTVWNLDMIWGSNEAISARKIGRKYWISLSFEETFANFLFAY